MYILIYIIISLINTEMTELSKYINILIEYGQKIQSSLNKKYRPFVKSIINLKDLAKNTNPTSIKLTKQIIVFKLGFQSKSVKGIQISLVYLLRLFKMGFVDINQRNYCEMYEIQEKKINVKPEFQVESADLPFTTQLRHQFLRLLTPLVHFKNIEINNLLLRVYQYLITEPILLSLIEMSEYHANQQIYQCLVNYYSYRVYMYEEYCLYNQEEIIGFRQLTMNQKIIGNIRKAMDRQDAYTNLIQKYVHEIVSRVSGEGGKYGLCVICSQPADHYCKMTKASLCGIQCKKKHIQIAEKEYRAYNQCMVVWSSIQQAIQTLFAYLSQRQSSFLFSVLAKILQSPSLCMVIKPKFRLLIRKYIPTVLDRAYQSKYDQTYETLYFLMAYLTKWWTTETLHEIQYFFKQNIMKIFNDKKPNFRHLMLVFKSLDKIFENGKTILQLYINLDCQLNRANIISQIIFELSKIAQDKYQNVNFYSKQQKIALKNSCLTLYCTLARSLNQYRVSYPQKITKPHNLLQKKQRKVDLERFREKFNNHWSQGLKSLFNLNIVGLESDQEIVNIIMTHGGLKKDVIDAMLFDKNCVRYLQIFMSRLSEEPQNIVIKLLELYQYVPLTQATTIAKQKFHETFHSFYGKDGKTLDLQIIQKLTQIFLNAKNHQNFIEQIHPYMRTEQQNDPKNPQKYHILYMKLLNARKMQTMGMKSHVYHLCMSHQFLQVISTQISLLQIPLSYLLQTNYPSLDKIIYLIKQLTPICSYSNWLALLVKNSDIQNYNSVILTQNSLKLIKGVLQIVISQADYINDWQTPLRLICNMHYLLTSNPNKKNNTYIQNKSFLSTQISINLLDNSILNSSLNVSATNFKKFIISILTLSLQQLLQNQQQQIFLLQKLFIILDINIEKYLNSFQEIFGEYQRFVSELQCKNNQAYIYICDMMKQFILKLLKNWGDKDLMFQDRITSGYFNLFMLLIQKSQGNNNNKDISKTNQLGLNSGNRQIGDFIMNCLSTIIMHHYQLQLKTWKIALRIVNQYAQTYPYQSGVIIRKILNQKMQSLHEQSFVILKICFKLIDADEEKNSIEAIHNVQMVIDQQQQFYVKQCDEKQAMGKQDENEDERKDERKDEGQDENKYQIWDVKIKQLLTYSLQKLINYLQFTNFSEAVAEVIFNLLQYKKHKSDNTLLLTNIEICALFSDIFNKLEQFQSDQQKQSGERILNQSLYWCVKNKIYAIIKNLQQIIINKYTYLSIDAIKCIKTYIQMSNPRDQDQWRDIQQTLLNIITNTQITRFFNLNLNKQQQQNNNNYEIQIKNILQNQTKLQKCTEIKISDFVHECRLQSIAVQLLPNDVKCLEVLHQTYFNITAFNDDIQLRVALWRQGLGSGINYRSNQVVGDDVAENDMPPDLLKLQEIISNRIMAIYIRVNFCKEILDFCQSIFKRYIEASQILEIIERDEQVAVNDCNDLNYEYFVIYKRYWEKRRAPMLKLICYILPKLSKYCKQNKDRKLMLKYLAKMLPLVQKRDMFLKSMKELTKKKYEQ